MHPALSVIFFTTASGAGYGLLALVGMLFVGAVPLSREDGMVAIIIGLGLVCFGLLSSTFHLGKPTRSWRAFSQWRTSWLSREGVASMVCFVPTLWLLWDLFGNVFRPDTITLLASTMMFMSVVTVYCTAMIYRSLPTIHQWHNTLTVPCYMMFALMSGAVLLNAILMVMGDANLNIAGLACLLCLWGLLLKRRYWLYIDKTQHCVTPESATGLGDLGGQSGKVKMFESPHSSETYLLKEMGFVVARNHARKLRQLTSIFGFWLPFVLCGFSIFYNNNLIGVVVSVVAVISVSFGMVVERWLFFAQARHVVTLYYGADAA